jgi:hypothetical protein
MMSVSVDVRERVSVDPTTVDSVGLDNIKPRSELVVPLPVRTETALDIRPVTMDLCLNINFGRIPPTCIRQPYHHHFGMTLFGVEIFGFTLSGEQRIIIDDLPDKPAVAWGGEEARSFGSLGHSGTHHTPGGGLRIRLGP